MNPKTQFRIDKKNLYMLTAFLIASKYDELDDHIPLMRDFQRYFGKFIKNGDVELQYQEIVECEREMAKFFNWDLMTIISTHFLQNFLANGVVFENEDDQAKKPEKISRIYLKAQEFNEIVIKNAVDFKMNKAS